MQAPTTPAAAAARWPAAFAVSYANAPSLTGSFWYAWQTMLVVMLVLAGGPVWVWRVRARAYASGARHGELLPGLPRSPGARVAARDAPPAAPPSPLHTAHPSMPQVVLYMRKRPQQPVDIELALFAALAAADVFSGVLAAVLVMVSLYWLALARLQARVCMCLCVCEREREEVHVCAPCPPPPRALHTGAPARAGTSSATITNAAHTPPPRRRRCTCWCPLMLACTTSG